MAKEAQSDAIFIATTALEEFWDVSKPMVFLGEWCLLYKLRANGESLNNKVLSSPYDNVNVVENAYHYVNRLYEQMLPLLGSALNSIHGKNHSDRYWRILLGPWLQLYLSGTYDRFVNIKHALHQHPNFTTIGLAKESFTIPTDTMDFAYSISKDFYNLQLYTKILTFLGIQFSCKKMNVESNCLHSKSITSSWKHRAIDYLGKLFINVSVKFYKSIFLRNTYFSKKNEIQLAVRNIGRILPSWNLMTSGVKFEYDSEKRNVLRTIAIGVDEFEQCLCSMFFSDMPQCFVEGFSSVEDEVYEQYPKQTKAIFSANSWYYDEIFKQWAAIASDKGVMLLGTQHGGNYGVLKYMPSENHETAIVDYYYSWGWNRTDCTAKVTPMPATKLVARKKIEADNSKKGILWVATSAPRYVIQLPFLPMHFHEYLTWQERFANALPQEALIETRFRAHYENYEWGTVERLKDCIPEIQIEAWDVPFQLSLEHCRLYVCDHLSTTFVESLAANKPTVLFWNPEINILRPEAQPYFDMLREGGILFNTPEVAASVVAAVYDDIEGWWNRPERQKSIRLFCEQFARTSPDAITLWSNELNRILTSTQFSSN